ncbi:MAG: hypothetical protein D6732_24030 [Methanobacteriota archaeon]|nr:MAG: hypothetical protein D6732_24030 [Euryarchaeota archaeon]
MTAYYIGFTGPAGSGKNTAASFMADYLTSKGFVVVEMSFAEALKKGASEFFGLPMSVFHDRERKESVDPYWGISPRRMLQILGTEVARTHFGEDFWIRRLVKEIQSQGIDNNADFILITDVRFDNEADFIRENGGRIVFLRREGVLQGQSANHASEAGVVLRDGDFVINNNSSLDALKKSTTNIGSLFAEYKRTHDEKLAAPGVQP